MAGERILQPNAIAFAGGRVVASPFQFYLDGADNIRVEGWNTCVGAALEVHGRAINEFGETQTFNMVLPLTADRIRNRRDFAAVRGFILNIVVAAVAATPCIGQTFARVSIIRGFTGGTIVLGVLLQGYVTAQQGLGWPGSPIESSIAGGGYMRAITGTNPAVGAEMAETVPEGALWELISLRMGFTTNAVAGDRRTVLILSLGLNTVYDAAQFQTVPASSGPILTWAQGLAFESSAGPNYINAGLPNGVRLSAGSLIYTVTAPFGVTDDYGAPNMLVREWLEVD